MHYRFSANIGYLWQEHPFLERLQRAADNGFTLVEFHDEAQQVDRAALLAQLQATGLSVVGLNVRMERTMGCAAIPHQQEQARRDIRAAINVAEAVGASAIHLLSGVAKGESARAAYLDALRFALDQSDLTVLIEPISHAKVPGYFLRTVDQAAEIIATVDHPRLKIQFDCYHVQQEHGELLPLFERYVDHIGHVQIASFPDRQEPYPSDLNYRELLAAFQAAGYNGVFGCEYTPKTSVEEGLGWRALLLAPT